MAGSTRRRKNTSTAPTKASTTSSSLALSSPLPNGKPNATSSIPSPEAGCLLRRLSFHVDAPEVANLERSDSRSGSGRKQRGMGREMKEAMEGRAEGRSGRSSGYMSKAALVVMRNPWLEIRTDPRRASQTISPAPAATYCAHKRANIMARNWRSDRDQCNSPSSRPSLRLRQPAPNYAPLEHSNHQTDKGPIAEHDPTFLNLRLPGRAHISDDWRRDREERIMKQIMQSILPGHGAKDDCGGC